MVNFSFSGSISGLENIFAAYRLSTLDKFGCHGINLPVVTFSGAGGVRRPTSLIVPRLQSDRLTKNRHSKATTATLRVTPITTFWLSAMPSLLTGPTPSSKFTPRLQLSIFARATPSAQRVPVTQLKGFTKFHVVTSQPVMFISCALRARIKDGTGFRQVTVEPLYNGHLWGPTFCTLYHG